MKTPSDAPNMPPEMLQKLHAVLGHERRVRLQTGLLRAVAVLLTAMLVVMTIDWLAAFHGGPWRWLLTISALTCGGAALLLGCLIPLLRPRSLNSAAREVDRAHPSLEERCQTLTEFSDSPDRPEIRGSEAMIRKVAQQTAAMSGGITPRAVVSRSALTRAGKFLAGAAAVFALFFIVDFPRAKVLCQRFFAPGADITLTQVQSKTGDLLIGRGEDVTLEFTATGKAPDSASLTLKPAGGRDEVVDLSKDTKTPAGSASHFVYTANAVTESFDYRARSGDGETAWHHVTVLERPKLAQVQMRIVAPAYSKLPVVEEKTLPRQVRALEGSSMEVSFQSDQPLASMDLKFSDGKIQHLTESADHRYHFNTTLSNSLAFEPVLMNTHHLDNQARPNCQVVVYPDLPPTVTVTSPSDKITARPDDILKIEFEARDDFGLSKAELVVTVKRDDETNATPVVIPIPLDSKEAGAKLVHKQVDLDLSKFNLKQDQELTYSVRVSDTKNSSGLSTPGPEGQQSKPSEASPQATAQNQAPPQNAQPNSSQQNTAQNSSPQKSSPNAAQPNQPQQNTAQNSAQQNTAQNSSPSKTEQNQQANQQNQAQINPAAQTQPIPPDTQNHILMQASNKSNPNTPPPGASQPPPNPLGKRALDVAQSSTCQPMHVIVDEWARPFDGQMREKQELAIDPTMKLLGELLRKAQDLTGSNLVAAAAPGGLSQSQSPALEEDKDQLRQAEHAVGELKKVSTGTPYAFIGLQISDISDTHVVPARENLGEVAMETAKAKDDRANLEQASFHIMEARKMLADLTKSYESVKRDNKLADAMQELKKMHQIFLEDTQAMLAAKKPVLNPVDRKVAEVDDAFADKLSKLLEEKKKIMAELAKILADDPRMLRRFMALMELDGTSMRDQMTLLARRQQDLTKQTAQWAVANEQERPVLAKENLVAQSAEQSEITAMAGKLHENMITWLPDGVAQDQEPIATALTIAAEGARQAAEASSQASPDTIAAGLVSARKALDQFRLLHDYLPEMSQGGTDAKDLSVFTANRLNETGDLITRESGWIKKMEALQKGDFVQVAEVDQHRLTLDMTTLSEKIDAAAPSFENMSPEIHAKSDELNHTVHGQILPEESRAEDFLARKTVKEAVNRQESATTGFAKGEKQFDELLRLIVAKMDAAPPPTDPGRNQTLEDMLAMLKDEKKAAEGLGIPNRPINVQIMKDWMSASSGSKSGSGTGGASQQNQARRAQARAAQQQARDASRRTDRMSAQAKALAQQRANELSGKETDATLEGGPKPPANAWNTIASQLGDELRQGRDNVPPEQYRAAIEQYFSTISETVPAAPAPAKANNP